MTKPTAKKTPPIKKSDSKESSASTLITGAEMRAPSVNPVLHTPVTLNPHLIPQVSPDHQPKPEQLRHSSTISQKDGRDKGSRFAFAAHPLQMDMDGSYFVDEGGVKVYETNFRREVAKAPRDARKKSAAQFTNGLVANAMIRWIQDRAVLERQRKPDFQNKRRNMFDPKERKELMTNIEAIASLAEDAFRSEPRVLKVNQPVIVFGEHILSDFMTQSIQ